MLSVNNIYKTFNHRIVLENITFSQDKGETLVFMGKNGVGKTTLFRIIAGLMSYNKGSIFLNGNNLLNNRPINRKRLFYLGHAPGMYYAFSAFENLKLAMKLRGLDSEDSFIYDVLDQFQLSEQKNDPIGIYSEGMLQRLKFVLAELIDWDLLLIDEPFSSLDAYGKKIVNEKINNWKSQDKTISIILHDENTAKNFADRILKIRSGILENN